MKKLLIVMLSLAAISSAAFADSSDDVVVNSTGVSQACATQIENAAFQVADSDSRDDGAREHDPWLSPGADKAKTDGNTAYVEIDFTVTDADDYWYDVTVSDVAGCKFTIKSEQSPS